jgi:hypothetical protein
VPSLVKIGYGSGEKVENAKVSNRQTRARN